MRPNKQQIDTLARMAMNTRPEEISCDDWLALAARYAELEISGQPISEELQPVVDHLRLCPNCTEELEALREALRED